MYRWGFVSVAVLSSMLIVGLGPRGSLLERVLSVPVIRWIGDRSYGIYLFSWPIQVFTEIRLASVPRATRDLLIIAGTIGLAAVSYRLLERPVVEGLPPWRRRASDGSRGSRTGRVPGVVVGSFASAALVV